MNDIEQEIVEEERCCGLALPKGSKTDIGWLLVGGGAIASLIALLRREQHATDWVLPVGLIAAGVGGTLLLVVLGRLASCGAGSRNGGLTCCANSIEVCQRCSDCSRLLCIFLSVITEIKALVL